jgi:hypothetical protein
MSAFPGVDEAVDPRVQNGPSSRIMQDCHHLRRELPGFALRQRRVLPGVEPV